MCVCVREIIIKIRCLKLIKIISLTSISVPYLFNKSTEFIRRNNYRSAYKKNLKKHRAIRNENNIHVHSQDRNRGKLNRGSFLRACSRRGNRIHRNGSGFNNPRQLVRQRTKSDKSASGESASLAIDFSFDLGVATTDPMSMLFPERSSKLKARRARIV